MFMLPVLEPHFENESSELLDIFAKKKKNKKQKPSTIIINVLNK
jgi:hypothetical protein